MILSEKKIIPVLLGFFILTSCQKFEGTMPDPIDYGYLSLNLSLTITSEEANGRILAVSTDDFRVTIFAADGTEVMVFDPYSSAPAEVSLPTGEYYVEAHSNNLVDAAFENPYYFGRSDDFTIDKEELKSIDIEAELANTKVAINYSTYVVNTFHTYTGTVTVLSSGASLFYAQGETREGYFLTSPLGVEVNLSYTKLDGSTIDRTFTASIADPQPKTLYNINVDATLEDGKIVLNITVDEGFDTVDIELGDIASESGIDGCRLTHYFIIEGMDQERWDVSYDQEQLDVIDKSDNSSSDTHQWTFQYDAVGRLSSATAVGNYNAREEFSYNAAGQMVRRDRYRDYGAGLEHSSAETFGYNLAGQITTENWFQVNGDGSETLSEYYTYQYTDLTNNPSIMETYNGDGTLRFTRTYTYDDKINFVRTSELWKCINCLDFEFIPFTDNNVTHVIIDDNGGPDDGELTAAYTYNQYGYPAMVDYRYGSGERFQQHYQFECEGPQDLDSDGDGLPDIVEIPGCQDNPRC